MKKCLTITIVVFALSVIGYCDDTVIDKSKNQLRFLPKTSDESETLCWKIIKDRSQIIEDAIQSAKDTTLGLEGRAYAIYLLGQIRAETAVSDLIGMIDFDVESIMRYTRIQPHGRFPAQVALVNIGMPSVKQVLKCLPLEPSAQKRHMFCTVVRDVLGGKAGRAYLEEELNVMDEKKTLILNAYDESLKPRQVK